MLWFGFIGKCNPVSIAVVELTISRTPWNVGPCEVGLMHGEVDAAPSSETGDRCVTTWSIAAVGAATVFAFFVPASTPATPCDTRDTRTPTATAVWTGVSEVVVVDVDAGGVVSGSPSQTTVVTAASSSTVHVGVPMSAAGLRRIGPGSPPPVVDDVAEFSFDRSGTQTQTVSSDFVQPLPVTVTPSYQLDGQPTTPDELTWSLSDPERRSGVLTVTYEIANVTSQTTTVSFIDAAGTARTEAITQAVPIAGALTLTLPKNASGIDAAGADLTPGPLGVGASWTVLLAPPLAPARQSISYSMNVTNAQIPRARLALAVIVPARPPTGEAPAAIGAAVATSQAAAQAQLAQAQAEAQASLEQVQADLWRSSRHGRVGGHWRTARPTRTRTTSRGCPTASSRTCRKRSRRPRRTPAQRSRLPLRRFAMHSTACDPLSPITPIG